MANVSKPAGLAPIRHLLGGNPTFKGQVYYIASTDINAFAVGDPVVLSGEADANGIPGITLATAGTDQPILGAIVSAAGAPSYGVVQGVPAESPVTIPATKTRDYYVMVEDDPWVIFEIQEDSDGGSIAAASVGLNANLIAAASNGYVSGWQIDSSSVNSGSGRQVKLLRAVASVDNALGTYCKWEVMINLHVFKAGTTGI
jgi:hypothetical protein